MEAVVERLDIKQQLLAKVDEKRRPGSIVSSNTSGIPIAAMAEGRSDDFRKHWLGTHFFNPPRYLRLLEIIPTAETDPAVVAAMVKFGDHVLGKGVVIAKDTPNFIANHVGLYGVARTLDALAGGKYTIEEIDAITGPALGRPGSATFRTMDIAGIDVLAHVLRNLGEHLPTEVDRSGLRRRRRSSRQLIANGALGEKTGKGFYERRKSAAGETEIWTLDPATLEYRQKQSARIALDRSRQVDRRRRRARQDAVQQQGQGRRVPARDARADARLHGARHAARSRIRSTMSIARCDGDSAGTSVRSSCSTRSASRTCSPPPKARTRWKAACRR